MKVTVTQPVTIALRTLGEDDRRRVTSWFRHLENWENDEFVRDHSRPEAKQVIVTGVHPSLAQLHLPQGQPAQCRQSRADCGLEELIFGDGTEFHDSIETLSLTANFRVKGS